MPLPNERRRYCRTEEWKSIRSSAMARATVHLPGWGKAGVARCQGTDHLGLSEDGRCPNLQGQPSRTFGDGTIVALAVCHLDHDWQNNRASNLRVLCQGCHNRHDASHRGRTRALTWGKKRYDEPESEGQQQLSIMPPRREPRRGRPRLRLVRGGGGAGGQRTASSSSSSSDPPR